MAAQGSKRPRQKLPVLLKGLGTIIGSLLLYSTDQSRPRSTQIQRGNRELPSWGRNVIEAKAISNVPEPHFGNDVSFSY